jgi:hypothetical protein
VQIKGINALRSGSIIIYIMISMLLMGFQWVIVGERYHHVYWMIQKFGPGDIDSNTNMNSYTLMLGAAGSIIIIAVTLTIKRLSSHIYFNHILNAIAGGYALGLIAALVLALSPYCKLYK